MHPLRWIRLHFPCPNNSNNTKKTRKRDKSEGGIDSQENNYNRQDSNSLSNSINALYTKHFEKHLRRDQNSFEDQFDEEENSSNSISNKIKTKISVINKDTKSLSNLPGFRKQRKLSKEDKNSSLLNQNLKSLDLNQNQTTSKLATLPFDKKSRLNLESSLISNSSLETSTNSSTRTISNSSSISADTDSGINQSDYLNKNHLTSESSLDRNQDNIMLMTSSNKTLGYSSSSSSINANIYQSPHSVVQQQPQFVSSTNMSSTSTLLTPNSPIQNCTNQIQTLTPASSSQTNINNGNKINSLSYLDDCNLKLACIDQNDFTKLIKIHSLIDQNEWLAFNTKMYFDQINVLFGAIAEHCTFQTCPTMNAPCNNQFFWLDEKGKKFKYSASQYIDTSLTYIAKLISDESLFPIKHGHQFPSNFESLVKRIHKHLFQILAHMYHSHYKELLHLKLNSYINSIYFHLYLFSKSFNTIDDKDLEIMDSLNKSLLNKYINSSVQQQQFLFNQQPPTIHNPTPASSSSTTSSGFSFFKKKLNFNLMT